uniref:Uncharacterized protein n=1 Tax=Anguilla anguilla TaxID=7936 RepID=A0A0E9RXY9_ANGAN
MPDLVNDIPRPVSTDATSLNHLCKLPTITKNQNSDDIRLMYCT